MLHIKHISENGNELEIIKNLFREYEKELDENICFQRFETELMDPLSIYGAPEGDLILAYWNTDVAGCIALKKMKEKGVCEMKRLYVKPAFRKNRIGRQLVEHLVVSAFEKNYTLMRLDTLQKLQPAIRLYESLGFSIIRAYYNNPLPGVVYMEKELKHPG